MHIKWFNSNVVTCSTGMHYATNNILLSTVWANKNDIVQHIYDNQHILYLLSIMRGGVHSSLPFLQKVE